MNSLESDFSQTAENKNLIRLVSCFLAGEKFHEPLTADMSNNLFALANKHDVAHLVGEAFETPDESYVMAKNKAIFRYVKQDFERERIYGLFEAEAIPFIPLKGSVIRHLYPEAWQRTGCDIDILVRPCDLDKARAALEKQMSYTFRIKSGHDYSLLSPNGVHLELHYAFDEKEVPLDEVWETAEPTQEGAMQRAMRPELFVLHHIAHMAKHFRSGGCGLRPFIDLWFIKHKMAYDEAALNRKLHETGLAAFTDVVFGLLDLWFAAGESTPLLEATAEYILPAGVYGSMKNHVAVGQLDKGGKSAYFLSRLFLKPGTLVYSYPILDNHPWLLPFCQVHRWFRLLCEGKLNRIRNELKANSTMENDYRSNVEALLKALEL